jgi:hypothetical protein
MTDNKPDPRKSYDFLIATACARTATAISLRHSARALRIVGDLEAARDYELLAATYDRIAERYINQSMRAPDSPSQLSRVMIDLSDLANFPIRKIDGPGNLS